MDKKVHSDIKYLTLIGRKENITKIREKRNSRKTIKKGLTRFQNYMEIKKISKSILFFQVHQKGNGKLIRIGNYV